MCGFLAAFFSTNEDAIPAHTSNLLKASNHRNLKGRGPNASNVLMKRGEFWAFHNLSIVAPDATESYQPLHALDATLVCNGEIYNYKKLIQQFDLQVTTPSDCEIIIHLYRRLGIKGALGILDGVFSFVLIDRTLQKVFIARDHFGVRPLFTGSLTVGHGVAFASTAAPLLEICTDVKQHPSSMFSTYNMQDLMMSQLEEAFVPVLPNSRNRTRPGDTVVTEQESIRQALYAAVNKRIDTAHVPYGCLLSGGLDS